MFWHQFARRVFGSVIVLFLASFLSSLLLNLVPGDAAELVVGEDATAQQVEKVREEMGLNDPFITQYLVWMGRVLRGDFGTSYISGRPVAASLLEAAPATLSLALMTMGISMVIGVILGGAAGAKRGTWVDRIASLFATLGLAMPSFWVGLLLVSTFALTLSLFPATGYVPFSQSPGLWLMHLILPAIALGSTTAAEIMRQTRSGISDVLDRPYIRTARAKGARGVGVMRRHVARNAAIPVVTVFGLQFGQLFGGVIVVEQVFAIPGLGTLAVDAALSRDLPVLQGYILITACVIVVVNLLIDMSYRFIDPKVSV
jgi:peptide/nickel transport system permease protein